MRKRTGIYAHDATRRRGGRERVEVDHERFMELVAEGLSTAQIGRAMNIGPNVARRHARERGVKTAHPQPIHEHVKSALILPLERLDERPRRAGGAPGFVMPARVDGVDNGPGGRRARPDAPEEEKGPGRTVTLVASVATGERVRVPVGVERV